MNIQKVPDNLQTQPHRYPPHNDAANIEQVCSVFLRDTADIIKTDVVYLPITWTNNYVHDRKHKRVSYLSAVDECQKFLDGLDRSQRYATVVQCADGIYETIPDDLSLTVFGAGGVGDIPIPLSTKPHVEDVSLRIKFARETLAGFVGSIECGGPINGVNGKSSWNPDGIGAQLRRKMYYAFRGKEKCIVEKPEKPDVQRFRDVMLNSVFGLAPRGYGLTSFRLYEAMEMGAIPVYISDKFWIPYTDLIDWHSFALLCKPEDLDNLPQRLLDISIEDVVAMQSFSRTYYKLFFTHIGVARQVARMLENI